MSRVKRRHKVYLGIAMGTVLLNVIAWNSTVFCDAYIAYIFPVWVNTYGRVTGIFPFSIGEWMIAAGILLVAVAVLTGLTAGMLLCLKRVFPIWWRRFIKCFYSFFGWTVLAVLVIMTLNCFVLYHASTFSQKYFGADTREHSLEELLSLYNEIARQCNDLSGRMQRAEDGSVVYPGGISAEGKAVDMEEKSVEIMRLLGKTYSQLDGYYPKPKPLLMSDFMCQQYMQGYYFPFSMEANYNDVMYILNKPATMCHELAHLRGYIFEDEANFISYLACVQSDDIYFQYSGYLSVLPYVVKDLYKAKQTSPGDYETAAEKEGVIVLLSQVYEDDIFVTDEEWERINGKAFLDTETVDKLSDTFVDATLKINGVTDGMVSYSRVVELLLQYQKIAP